MEIRELALESIDLEDERFRISESLTCPQLEASLREIGQLSPVLLFELSAAPPAVVCGFRRIHALRKIGRRAVFARCFSPSGNSPLDAFRTALWDNLSHRQLNALEKARVLNNLKYLCGVDHDSLVADYLPLLDLAPHKNVLRNYLHLHTMLPGLRSLLLEGKLTLASVERLSCRSQQDQITIAGMFGKARWSASLQRQLLDLVEELATVNSCGFEGIVREAEISGALNDPLLSPFQRGERVFEILYRRRNPQLSRAREKFRDDRQKLGLPGEVRLTPEPFFETSRIRVEFDAQSAEGLRQIVSALQQAAQSPVLDHLFQVS